MSLTKTQLLERLQRRERVVPIDGIGEVLIRSRTEVQRLTREWRRFDGNGEAIEREGIRRRVYLIIDQVCTPDGDPMFTADDVDELLQLDSELLDALYVACLSVADEETEEKKTGDSGDSETS